MNAKYDNDKSLKTVLQGNTTNKTKLVFLNHNKSWPQETKHNIMTIPQYSLFFTIKTEGNDTRNRIIYTFYYKLMCIYLVQVIFMCH